MSNKEIPIEWHTPEKQITLLATHVVAQRIEDIIKISFFEINPPIQPVQLDESMPIPAKVRADCIASIFVTPDKLSGFIKTFQKQIAG